MKASELKELSAEELITREKDLRGQLFEMKVRHNTGILESTADLGQLKRDLARVLTVRRQLELQVNPRKR